MNSRYMSLLAIILCTAVPKTIIAVEITQKTTGWCSPAVSDVKGKVTIICNGVDPKAMARLNELLDLKDKELAGKKMALQDKIKEAEEWSRKYRELEQRLSIERKESSLALKAKTLLQEGKLEEAGKLLDQLLQTEEAEVESIASHHYSRAQIYALQFKQLEALPHYSKAYGYRPEKFEYASAYANILASQNRLMDAVNVYYESLKKIRKLAADNPAYYLPPMAYTLNNLGQLYSATQRFGEAEKTYLEAIWIFRKLPADNPVFLPGTLCNLGVLYSTTQRFGEAEKAYQEALGIFRKLAADNSVFNLSCMADILKKLGALYGTTQHFGEAEKAYQEELGVFRKLTADYPGYLPLMAEALNNLGMLYGTTQRLGEAEKAFKEELEIRHKLPTGNPSEHKEHKGVKP